MPVKTVSRLPVSRNPLAPRGAAPVTQYSDPLLSRASGLSEQMFAPLFAKLGAQRAAAENNARSAYNTHASALENALKATSAPIVGAFDKGVASAAAVNEAVANRLNNVGQQESGGLAAKLAQISADPSTATDLSKFYTNAGNAGFASGAADLQHLIGRRSEAESYQGKLPGISRLTANQDLQSALGQFRQSFGEQEGDLRNQALQQASSLYGDFRQEQAQTRAQNQAAIQQKLEIAAEERASLRALKAAAISDAEKRQYAAQEKALDRQLKADIAQLNANTRLATDNPPRATARASGPTMRFNPDGSPNPNYSPPTSAKGGKDGKGSSGGDNWTTAGSAKRDRVVKAAESAVVIYDGNTIRFTPEVLRRLRKFPQSPDQIINTAINAAIKKQVPGVNLSGASAKAIRDAIRQQLNGKRWTDSAGRTWQFEA